MNKSLYLLYSFAYGAVLEKMMGLKDFTGKIREYLEGNAALENELKKSVPKLIIAFNHLKKESKASGKDFLDLELVKNYVFGKHNLLMPRFCAVKAVKIIKIDAAKKIIQALDESSGKKVLVKFLPKMVEGLKAGDSIAIHYNWLVSKINQSQRASLLKNPGLNI